MKPYCEAEQLPLDRISTLPQPILETILCLLSTKEAARTSILSREWRYRWTGIPKLKFKLDKITIKIKKQMSVSEPTSEIASTRKKMDMNDLHQVLLLRQGPIHELTISMRNYWEYYDCCEFDRIILHLSRNHTIKKLTLKGLYNSDDGWYKLPVSVFSLHHLTDLYLYKFDIDYPPTFDGFGSLGSLYLRGVIISTKNILHLLSNCPSLKSFSLEKGEPDDDESNDDDESDDDDESEDDDEPDGECTINELLKCLPVIERLTISNRAFQWLVPDPVPQELPTSLIHLKYLRLEGMCITEDYRLAFHVLIKCSPNLEGFELEVYDTEYILLLRQGPIYELTLQLSEYEDAYLELDQIVSHLSRNYTVKKLTLYGWYNDCGYKVPISIFSFHHLQDLVMSKVDLYHPPIFNGFDSLESLVLRDVAIPTKTLLHLLLNCPSLKNLSLLVRALDDKCTINELLACLPAIEHLTTWPHISEWVVLDSVPQKLPTSLIHLRYLCFKDMTLVERCGLAFLLVFIKCSPNLEKVKLQIYWGIILHEKYSFEWKEYSDVWLEHLNELEIEGFKNSKPEMDFVKFILARSPKLKKVTISCIRSEGHQTELEMLRTLLQAPRVSPEVRIASKAFNPFN
ncbi:putative FBD domain, leucine-rich repeat domain superfamily, F-box-like domain superfamily [Helianthus annuus]|nr:putative FBD domain, leucine-rich repeat domain superfamily, F-box-like domain superfamily [Helianthus annuus]